MGGNAGGDGSSGESSGSGVGGEEGSFFLSGR